MFSELAARLPELPRWVETRGMLLFGLGFVPVDTLAIFQPEVVR